MQALKLFVFVAVLVAAMAAEEERIKKDVYLGSVPYAYAAVPHAVAYDDGKYYPGKYEKAIIAPALHTVSAHAVPAISTYASAVPAYPAVHVAGYHPYVY